MKPTFIQKMIWSFMLLFLAGCQTYTPKPIDLESFDRQWSTISPDSLLPSQASDPNNSEQKITLAMAEEIMLFGNPQLRRSRSQAGLAEVSAEYAGLWDDPELRLGLLKNQNLTEDNWFYGVSLGFTIPLSGRLAIEKDQANKKVDIAYLQVIEMEWQTKRQFRQAWFKWLQVDALYRLEQSYLNDLETIIHRSKQLAQAGELSSTDVDIISIEYTKRQLESSRLAAKEKQLQLELFKLMGLKPNPNISLVNDWPTAQTIDLPSLENIKQAFTQSHPTLLIAKENYALAELDLHREIKKQYPDISLGPAFEHEEGQSKIGLGLGLPLGILNANKQGIAQSHAKRDTTRIELESTYQTVVTNYLEAKVRWEFALQQYELTKNTFIPLVEKHRRQVQTLLEMGEIDYLRLKDALVTDLQAHMELINAHMENISASHHLQDLIIMINASNHSIEKEDKND